MRLPTVGSIVRVCYEDGFRGRVEAKGICWDVTDMGYGRFKDVKVRYKGERFFTHEPNGTNWIRAFDGVKCGHN